ncbi:MAG: hypothetical protein ACFFDW_13795 [Candidatus Thorarchaeota archaeon]
MNISIHDETLCDLLEEFSMLITTKNHRNINQLLIAIVNIIQEEINLGNFHDSYLCLQDLLKQLRDNPEIAQQYPDKVGQINSMINYLINHYSNNNELAKLLNKN